MGEGIEKGDEIEEGENFGKSDISSAVFFRCICLHNKLFMKL